MASNCPYWKGSRCVTPNKGDTGPCSYSGSDYKTGCCVFRLTAAQLAGKGTLEAMQEAGALSPFGLYTVVSEERNITQTHPLSSQEQAEEVMIEFKCPRCSALLGVPSSLAGKNEVCPGCQHEVQVPAQRDAGQDWLQQIFLCDTPAEVEASVAKLDDDTLVAAFAGLDMACIPLNTFCRKYFSHPRGTDSRIITLAIALASLAKAGRSTPAAALADKMAAKFSAKVQRGPSSDTAIMPSDEWRIHAAVNKFLVDCAKELLKDGVDKHDWALAMLDAIATDWPEDDIVLFWRAAAAYNIWGEKKENAERKALAHRRMTEFLSNTSHRTMDARSVNMIRDFRDAMH